MVILGQRARSLETSTDPKLHQVNEDGQTQNQKICGYEKFREERIKENLERMKKLGILDLSLKLKNTPKPLNPKNNNNNPSIRKTFQRLSPLPPSGSVRRSSRLGNVTPVSYSEVHLSKKGSFETEAALQEVKGKARTLESAKAFKSDNPFFMVVVHRSYVSRYSVSLSKAFVERYITKDRDNVILQVTAGGTWPAKCTLNSTTANLSGGWNAFARDNHLAAGDVCVFELINSTKKLLKAVIFRTAEYTNG